jgi:D-alanine-D-alanine ligase-like ATP-grasp enzyme
MGKLKIVVLYDRVLVDESEEPAGGDKSPVVRTLDKKEVEEEVAEVITKLGHEPVMYELDGTQKSLLGLAKVECDLVFNLAESFADDDTADFKIAAFLELLGKKYTGTGTHGLMLAQDKAVAKKIFAFHGIHTPTFAKSFRGRLDFSHDLQFPVIVKPAREDGSIGIEFSAVVNSIRELMERMDWLHANFDSPVLIEEYIDGREMYVGIIGNDKAEALPIVELDLSKLPDGTPRIAAAEVKWGKGTKAYRDTKSAVATDLSEELARRRYQVFKEQTWTALTSLRQLYHYHFVNAEGPIAEVQANILKELKYQSSLELDPRTFDLLRRVPLASEIVRHARQDLVRRLDAYKVERPEQFQSVVEFIQEKLMPIIVRHAISGRADINSEEALFHDPCALAMLIDVFSERGFHATVDLQRVEVPDRVDLQTGEIHCRMKKVYCFTIRFKGSQIRRG